MMGFYVPSTLIWVFFFFFIEKNTLYFFLTKKSRMFLC